MADQKLVDLTSLSSPAGTDLMYISDAGVDKKITLANLFGNIPSNTSITGTITSSGKLTVSSGGADITGDITQSLGATRLINSLISSNTLGPEIRLDNDGTGANKSLIVTIIKGEEDKNNDVIPGFDMVILSGIIFLIALYKRQKKTSRKVTP